MDCKILKKTLFISILAISLFYTGEVKALKACSDKVKIYSKPSITKTYCEIKIDKVRQRSYFYKFYIGGNVALCMNPGKHISKNTEYVIESVEPITNVWEQRAYAYARKKSDDLAARLTAQTIVWYVEQFGDNVNESDLKNAVCSSFASAQGDDCTGIVKSECETHFNNVKNITSTEIVPIYSWRTKTNTEDQRLISQIDIDTLKNYITQNFGAVAGGGITTDVQASLKEIIEKIPGVAIPEHEYVCEDKCSLTVDSNEADCGDANFNSTVTAGNVYQIATGSNCSNDFDPTNNITYDGQLEINDINVSLKSYYQVHCLSRLTQNYPGNVSTSVLAGGHLVWPNNGINAAVVKAGLTEYPLSLTYLKTCKMDVLADDITTDDGQKYEGLKTIFATAYKDMSDKYNTGDENEKAGVMDFAKNRDNQCPNSKNKLNEAKKALTKCQTEAYNKCVKCSETDQDCLKRAEQCQKDAQDTTKNCGTEKDAVFAADTQVNACDGFQKAYNKVTSIVSKWKAAVKYSNYFEGISVSDFNADIVLKNEIDKNTTWQLQKVDSGASNVVVDITGSKSDLSDDPLDGENLRRNYSSDFTNEVDALKVVIANKVATVSRTIKYDLNLPSGLPRKNKAYVKKNSIKSIDGTTEDSNYTKIGYVNMPIPFNADLKQYSLTLVTNSVTGIPNEMAEKIKKNYVCHYTVSGPPPSCKCPDNSKNSEYDLSDIVKKEGISCAEAQAKYCGTTKKYVCPDGTKKAGFSLDECIASGKTYDSCKDELCNIIDSQLVCPSNTKNSGYDLSSCVNSGGTFNSCVSKWCNGDNPEETIKCPESTKATDGMSKQYRNCVTVKLNQGLKLEDAKNACNVFCKTKGQKIIYRTISLSNPFPSYDTDAVTQKNLKVGMFNDNIKGRYPGMNWNSTTTVKNKILNNRGVDGDAVYEKTPLYTFKLDAGTIQAIRKYNKNHKYSEFKLNCKMDHAAACISTFVHSSTSGRTRTGTCDDDNLTGETFYTCVKKG